MIKRNLKQLFLRALSIDLIWALALGTPAAVPDDGPTDQCKVGPRSTCICASNQCGAGSFSKHSGEDYINFKLVTATSANHLIVVRQ